MGEIRSRRPRLLTLAALASAALAIGACGSDSEDSDTGAQAGSSTTATQTADTPKGPAIKIGTICSCSGAQAASLGIADDGIKAWAKAVNASGGINGHPVELIAEEDAGDPAKGLQAAKKLIEEDKVVAIVSDYSTVDGAWAEYVESKNVAVIGGLSIETPFISNPTFFAAGASNVIEYVGFAKVLSGLGKKNLRILYCAEAPICALAPKLGEAAAASVGADIKISGQKISSTAPDYTAQCIAAKNAKVEALIVGANSTVVPRVVDSCSKQGFKPTVVAIAASSSPAWAENAGFEGAVVVGPHPLHTDDSVPGIKEFQEGFDAYKPDGREAEDYNSNAMAAWTAGKLFEAAATNAKVGPDSTPADVKKGLYALKGETLDGLTAPLTYTEGQPFLVPCWFTDRIEGGKYVPANDSKPECADEAALTKIGGFLKQLG